MNQVLEPVLSYLRISKVERYINKYSNPTLLDIGCGQKHLLLNRIKNNINKGYGIDENITSKSFQNITIINKNVENGIPFLNNEIDVITILAVLEHLNNPVFILREIERVLKPGGMLLMTVPSIWSKPVLEFLAFKLGIVDPVQIKTHKTYYNYKLIMGLFSNIEKLVIKKHQYFQIFMNNFVVGEKITNTTV